MSAPLAPFATDWHAPTALCAESRAAQSAPCGQARVAGLACVSTGDTQGHPARDSSPCSPRKRTVFIGLDHATEKPMTNEVQSLRKNTKPVIRPELSERIAACFRRWEWQLFVAISLSAELVLFLPPALSVVALVIIIASGMAWLWFTSIPPRSRVDLLRSILIRRDIADVGLIIDALGVLDSRIHDEAVNVLIELLPGIQARHVELFSDERLDTLARLLSYSQIPLVRKAIDPRFALAILAAFESVGSDRVAGIVARIARREPNDEIRNAAKKCLAVLQSRQDGRLLRTASAGDCLLRAGAPGGADRPDMLLQAAGARAGEDD